MPEEIRRGYAAVVARAGTSAAARPIGVQVAAAPSGEDTLIVGGERTTRASADNTSKPMHILVFDEDQQVREWLRVASSWLPAVPRFRSQRALTGQSYKKN